MQRLGVVACLCATLAALTGCQQQAIDPVYSVRKEVQELPAEKHKQQIADYLQAYFGPPKLPRVMMPGDEDSEDAAKAEADTASKESEADAKSTLAEQLKLTDSVPREQLQAGMKLYVNQCAGCHGFTGDGNGPAAAYLDPPPRDYRLGRFKFGSVERGAKPRRADLVRIIQRGAKGTSMPSFRWMNDDDMQAVVDYVIFLSKRGEMELLMQRQAGRMEEDEDFEADDVAKFAERIAKSWNDAEGKLLLPLTPVTPRTREAERRGAVAFIELGCFKCHGKDGRGSRGGNISNDDWGRKAYAADLTAGMLHGGRRPVDIYRRLHQGINGTPMPGFFAATANETPQQHSDKLWDLVHFITMMAENDPSKPWPADAIEEALQKLPPELRNETPATPAEAAPAAP